MKNVNSVLISSLLVLSAPYCRADAPAEQVSEPGFELLNKGTEPIWIALANGQTIDIPVKRLDSQAGIFAKVGRIGAGLSGTLTEGAAIIDINKPTRLFIWLSDPGQVNYGEKWWTFGESVPRIKPTPDYVYAFKQGKTLYLSWDNNKFIRPQTGLGGILGKERKLNVTDSGFPLSNNIQDSPDAIILKFKKQQK